MEETYATLKNPSLESQLEQGSEWSMTNEQGGLAHRPYLAGDALSRAGVCRNPVP
ncbi:hypothetical protein [Streptosporangium sp. NPDC087985]|uniref:hypothetical protein n=1 Tax=Streptosporangium sp. NPDC087985 TaxID=3366196 RepID=UPI00380769E9